MTLAEAVRHYLDDEHLCEQIRECGCSCGCCMVPNPECGCHALRTALEEAEANDGTV